MPSKFSKITTISDIDKTDASLFTDSQDVERILSDLGCKEDYGGIFIYNGMAYGFEGSVPYLNKRLYQIGALDES